MNNSTLYDKIYSVVCRIPEGYVATYGQIADLTGIGGHARQVGYALHNLPVESHVPWHRVINAKGEISLRSDGYSDRMQRSLLEAEGIFFDRNGRIPLKQFQWRAKESK